MLKAMVDGAPWRAGGPGGNAAATLYQSDSTILIRGTFVKGERHEEILLSARGVTGRGTYPLSGGPEFRVWPVNIPDPMYRREEAFSTRADSDGTMAVTKLDPKTRTIRGTFQFTAHSPPIISSALRATFRDTIAGNHTVLVTHGAFCGQYQIQSQPVQEIKGMILSPLHPK